MSFTANDVKTLRERTGAGMMDCKKALSECNGRFDEAVDFLKKQGLAKAVKKGGRIAAEGLIFCELRNNLAVMAELNCETDFVARNDDFLKLGRIITHTILTKKPVSVDEALTLSVEGVTLTDLINNNIAVIGEKLFLRRFVLMTPQKGGNLSQYNHANGRIVVTVEMTGNDEITDEVRRNIAMQVAAISPQYIDKKEVSSDVLNKEKEIFLAQMQDSGKPEEVLERIVQGKLDKFAGEISLMQQMYVKDAGGKQTVEAYLKTLDPSAKVIQFVRYAVGEGIEKRKDDFAEEVKKMTS